jgi:hypothetical protein
MFKPHRQNPAELREATKKTDKRRIKMPRVEWISPEPKVKINARIDASLHRWILGEGMTVSQATQEGITLLKETKERASDTKADTNTPGEHTNPLNNDIIVSQRLRERIGDLRKQIDLMSDQLNRKDDQITQLNEVTQKQAVHIQSLIQENSKLNMKLLPEVTENKKLW